MKSAIAGSIFSCALLAFLAACSPAPMAGNGSEVTNGLVASSAGPADSAMVIAFPAGYIPCGRNRDMPETTFTDKEGAFRMGLANTAWNLLVYDRSGRLGAFAERRSGGSAMGLIRLDSLGAVACSTAALGKDTMNQVFAGIAGSPFYTKAVKASSFIIRRVPPHAYRITLWVYSGMATAEPVLLEDSVVADATVTAGGAARIVITR
jgi:hypothetical protein